MEYMKVFNSIYTKIKYKSKVSEKSMLVYQNLAEVEA